MDIARQLPEIDIFFKKWYPPFDGASRLPQVQRAAESGDEQKLIDILYEGAWSNLKHKLDGRQRIQFKREFDQMLDALFPGRSRERTQEVEKYPTMAGLRKTAISDEEILEWVDEFIADHFKDLTEEEFHREAVFEKFYPKLKREWIRGPGSHGGHNIIDQHYVDIENKWIKAWKEKFIPDPDVPKYYDPIKKHKTDPYSSHMPGEPTPAQRKKEIEEAWHLLHGRRKIKKKAYKVPICPLCGKHMAEIDRWDDDDEDNDVILFHCQTPSCIALQDQDNDKWAENCQVSVIDDDKGPDYDEDVKYYEPIKKHKVEPHLPHMPGEPTPAQRKKEIDEAYHLLHGESRFSLYRNKDRASRSNRIRIAKRLSAQHETACVWCPELRPNEQPNMIKVGMEGSHGICEECKNIMLRDLP